MAVAIMLIGVGVGFTFSVMAWLVSSSLLLAVLVYPLGGALGCLLAGACRLLCRGRAGIDLH